MANRKFIVPPLVITESGQQRQFREKANKLQKLQGLIENVNASIALYNKKPPNKIALYNLEEIKEWIIILTGLSKKNPATEKIKKAALERAAKILFKHEQLKNLINYKNLLSNSLPSVSNIRKNNTAVAGHIAVFQQRMQQMANRLETIIVRRIKVDPKQLSELENRARDLADKHKSLTKLIKNCDELYLEREQIKSQKLPSRFRMFARARAKTIRRNKMKDLNKKIGDLHKKIRAIRLPNLHNITTPLPLKTIAKNTHNIFKELPNLSKMKNFKVLANVHAHMENVMWVRNNLAKLKSDKTSDKARNNINRIKDKTLMRHNNLLSHLKVLDALIVQKKQVESRILPQFRGRSQAKKQQQMEIRAIKHNIKKIERSIEGIFKRKPSKKVAQPILLSHRQKLDRDRVQAKGASKATKKQSPAKPSKPNNAQP